MLAAFIDRPINVNDFDNAAWNKCDPVVIAHQWSGEPAPVQRHAEARICWSADALHVRFLGNQHEPLVVSEEPQTDRKTLGLWDRDVCEIFVAPNPKDPSRYFEFEASPVGEWIDLGIVQTAEGRRTDWEYHSGMSVASRISPAQVIISINIPWSASIPKPSPNDVWLINLFRCVGPEAPDRYLAWRPTRTPEPNFHMPEAFGELHFNAKS